MQIMQVYLHWIHINKQHFGVSAAERLTVRPLYTPDRTRDRGDYLTQGAETRPDGLLLTTTTSSNISLKNRTGAR